MIVVVSKDHRMFLFISILLICLNPILCTKGQTLLPLEIRITELSYPPIVTIHDEDDPINFRVSYALDVKYDLENPNDEAVTVWMGMCYSLPFYHINATFKESGLKIMYSHWGFAMLCSQSFEPGLKANQSSRVKFMIESYTEEELPIGFYTIWFDIHYFNVFYPTIVSHAFMNITEKNVKIIIQSENRTDVYTRRVNIEHSSIFLSLIAVTIVIFQKRKRKNKKYFI
jgi:hypothetical protein